MAKVEARKFERKNFIVDSRKVRRVKKALHAASESKAVRVAVDRAFNAEGALEALEGL